MSPIDVDAYFAAEREAVELLPAPSGQYERVRRAAGRRRWRGPTVAAVVLALAATGVTVGTAQHHDRQRAAAPTSPRPVDAVPGGTIAAGAVPAHFKPLSVSFVSQTQGWALGVAPCRKSEICSAVVETTDGGRSWRATGVPAQASAGTPGNGIRFLDDRVGWIFGSGLWVTGDGGRTWHRQSAEPVHDLAVGGGRAYLLARCAPARTRCDAAKKPVVFGARRAAPAAGWVAVARGTPQLPDPEAPGYHLVLSYPWLYVVRPTGGLVPVPVGPVTTPFPDPPWILDQAARTAQVAADAGIGPIMVAPDRSLWRVGRPERLRRVGTTLWRPGYGNDATGVLPDAIAAHGRRVIAAYKLPGGPNSGSLAVSDDGGALWRIRVAAPLGIVDVQLHGRLGVALSESAAGTMYFSHDGGETWQRYRFP